MSIVFTQGMNLIPLSNTPTIVLDGLQLYFNVGDTNSYPGSGTTITDLSTNGYSGVLTNGVGYSSADGGYLTFDGSDDYIDTNQSLASEEFSVGAWFKSSAAGIKMILSKETNAGWPWNYRIWLNGGTIVGDIAQSGGTNTSISSTLSTYNNGNWYYVMFTRNDTTLKLYVNGSEIGSVSDTLTGTIQNSQEVWFGRSAYLGGRYPYNGNLGEMMIYNRVLSSGEILQNYNVTKTRYGL